MNPNLLLLIFLSIIAFSYQNVYAGDTNQSNSQITQKFNVDKMTCKMCHITVRKAIEQVTGVIDANVDYETKVATVIYNPSLASVEQIEKASANAGYPATLKKDK